MNHIRTARAYTSSGVLLVVVFNAAMVAPANAADPVSILPDDTLSLSADNASSTASGILHLRNDTDEDRPVTLTAGDFVSRTTKKGLNAKTVFFGPRDAAGQSILDTTVPKKSRLAVRVDVTNIWEAGESAAPLYNQGGRVGTIKVVKYRPPFNVKLATASNDKPELSFSKGVPQQLALRNDDAMTYTVLVTITVGEHSYGPLSLTIGPNSSDVLLIQPPDNWFTPAGFVREETRDGLVTLAFRPEGTAADPGWPAKAIPFKARLSRAPTFWLELTGYGFMFLLLLAGGICSLLLSNWVPNQLARSKHKARLSQLADRIRGLSSNRIDTRLQVSLRVARQRLYAELYYRWSISAELPPVLAAVSHRADALEKLLEQVEEIDRLLAKLEQLHADGSSPKQFDAIEARLRKAKELLSRVDPPQADVQAAKGLVEEAKAALDKAGQPDAAFAKDLAGRIRSLQAMKAPADPNDAATVVVAQPFREFADLLLDLFRRVDPFQREESIKPEDYGPLDVATTRIELIREYAGLYAGLGSEARTKLLAGTPFAALIRADGPAGRRAAKRTIQYMKEGIFPADIIAAIGEAAGALSIKMDPQVARQYAPMYFTVDFPKSEHNSCAALEDVRCEWDFHHLGLKEEGWRVWHYFPDATRTEKGSRVWHYFSAATKKEKQNVTVVFTNVATGQRVGKSVEKEFSVVAERSLHFGDRNWAELVRLAIALMVALLGLLAGARQEVLKLDLIPAAVAIFLLGFGADTIKNLLAPKGG